MQNSSVPEFRRQRIEAARKAAENQNQPQPDEQQFGGEPGGNQAQVDPVKEANDAAAWKGRLTKTQEELRAEREAKTQAMLEAAQVKEQARLAREEAEQARRALEEANNRLSVYQQKEQENFLSDEEKRQLAEQFGEDATDILTKVIAKARPSTPPVDVEATVDKKLQEANSKALEREWATAVMNQIPDAHILRADEDFIKFASEKKDWYGNTALSVMDDIGAKRDVSRINVIVNLIAEYKSQNNPGDQDNQTSTTVPPRNVPPTPTRPGGNGKKKVTSAEFHSTVNYYKSRGNTKGLREYLAGHEESK